ncbi:SDR family NAD(P)-dependent oxidoreductase [Bifidobacterium aemilianum]|uniref:SDR family NAD(P)-dependent oxidoreductase n=1 Tax=Bifidobacterium aemilianum TaxID=2493120 RepID=UPI001F2B868D|nr:SDR family NAD(P)-dependent oxidoreductase [Bifidobacterium aemilianum]
MVEFSIDAFALRGKVVLITGGASGLGKYYTQAVSKVGADVFVVSSSREGWEETRKQVEDAGRRVVFMEQDITEEAAAQAIVNKVTEEYGRIDVLINNAGMQRRHELVDFPDEDWKAVIDLNLNALYYLSHEVAKIMIDQGSGKIVNIGSMQSFRAGKVIYPYTASKHAVVGLTKAYADALAPPPQYSGQHLGSRLYQHPHDQGPPGGSRP